MPFGIKGNFRVISSSSDNEVFIEELQTPLPLPVRQKRRGTNTTVILGLTEGICPHTHSHQNSHIKTQMCFQPSSMWQAFEFLLVSIW